jgi:hypothetical protein
MTIMNVKINRPFYSFQKGLAQPLTTLNSTASTSTAPLNQKLAKTSHRFPINKPAAV